MTSCSGDGSLLGLEASAELFMPAPSQTGGLRRTKGSGRRLLNCESGTRLCPRDKQKGAIKAASCCASEAGYSAVSELRYTLSMRMFAMGRCTPGGCAQVQASDAMEGKDAHSAHDLYVHAVGRG